jgi:hypothetical protein
MKHPRGPRDAALRREKQNKRQTKRAGGEHFTGEDAVVVVVRASVRIVLLQGSDSSSNLAVDAASHFHHAPTHAVDTRGRGGPEWGRGGARGEAHIARRSENGLTKVIIGVASQCNGVMFRITDACVLARTDTDEQLWHPWRPRHAGPAPAPCASRPPYPFLGSSYTPARLRWTATRMANDLPAAALGAHTHAHARFGSRTARGSMRRMTPRTRWEAQHAALIDAIKMMGGGGWGHVFILLTACVNPSPTGLSRHI